MKKIIMTIFIFVVLTLNIIFCFAENTTNVITNITNETKNSINNNMQITTSGTIEFTNTPTIDQLTTKFEKKGNEVVKFQQRVPQPFSILMLILGAFMTIFGMAMGSKTKNAGISLMIGSVIIYVSILYAPEILDFFVNWMKN